MNPLNESSSKPSVAVIGGGLSGIAAATALCNRDFSVELFEARRQLGGRAGSFVDPQSKDLIDHCQHVSMGCCTNLDDLCRRTKISDLFTTETNLHFFGPLGQPARVTACPWLPCPLHLTGSLFGLRYLSLRERCSIGRTLLHLARQRVPDDRQTFLEWLQQRRQSKRTIDLFWSVILVSALAEGIDQISLQTARKIFVDGFMASRDSYPLQIPNVSLSQIYHDRLVPWLESQDVRIHLNTPVYQITGNRQGISGLWLQDRSQRQFDFYVLAVPWRRVANVCTVELTRSIPGLKHLEQFRSAPITGVHLWFDRPITALRHAVMVGHLSQWLFNRGIHNAQSGHYYQVVISGSRHLAQRQHPEIIEEVRTDLEAMFPEARQAELLRSKLVTDQHAVFVTPPGHEKFRPGQQTPIENLMLAGDWTRTGWPATMEGAVRSGYLAAEAILQESGRPERVLVDDLPRSWLARWLFVD